MDKVKFDILINATPAQKALMDFAKTVTKVVTKVNGQLKSISTNLNSVNKTSMGGFNKGITSANKNLSTLEKRMRKISSMAKGGRGSSGGANRFISGGMGLMGGYATFGLMGMLGGAVDSGNKFESGIADIKGILANAEGGFGNLEDKIRSVGRTSAFTITQMGEAAKFMAQAGMGSSAIGNSLGAVSNLGMVGNLDVGKSADIMTNIMASMGIDSKQSTAVTDILTSTSTNTNTNIKMLGQSFAYVGNIAAQTGTSINETAAAIGILGDAGIQGSRAGTNLRQMFLRLAAPTAAGSDQIEKLGLSLYRVGKDGHRALKPLSEIMDQFRGTDAGIEEFKDIFGVRGGAAFGALISGAEKYKKVLEKIAGSGGLTDQLAGKKMATTAGKTLVMKSVWEDLSITLMEKVRPAYNYVIEGITKMLDKLQHNKKFLQIVENVANGLAIGLRAAYHIIKFLFNFIVDNWSGIVAAISAIATVMGVLAIKSAYVALANPFTAWMLSIAGVILLYNKLTKMLPSTDVAKEHYAARWDQIKEGAGDQWKAMIGGFTGKDSSEMAAKASGGVGKVLGAFAGKDEFEQKRYDAMSYADKFKYIERREKAGTLNDDILGDITGNLRGLIAPKGSSQEKLLTLLETMSSTTKVNLGVGITGGTNEGDGLDTLSKASPLTSNGNEFQRSVIVNIGSLVENVNINGGLSSSEATSQIETQVSEVFIKVVSDFELGLSN